ncbi:MFS transporter [Afifella marina]|uniref:Fucose permease n=1 Tax=Afifella marina DSM 2698 TaxID=1120955 RepID=A0A1G5ML94_AFIMA|nr:MFS transporter [Afifella marina]MBK1623917.1 MFS transporter [Afifella marina DSM 2698]MBK1627167.1 MFS transporter [Afifella marina]MBK5918804.1 MFS transporter [Afifella marina]RAI22588.1 MFS transporter [Afifella marina DSM 2698]SCZ25987.1 Fucose permease [Afifella marina DSM 2698]
MTISIPSGDTPGTRLATRLSFFIAGFGTACWAPLVPYVKTRLGVDEAGLGLLLLCLGVGSVVTMPAAGALSGRIGARAVILAGSLGLAVTLPLLAVAPTSAAIAVVLFAFGASIGAVDVGANVHAVEVQEAAGIPLMSNFHGLYSVGGLIGAAGMTGALWIGLAPSVAALAAAFILALAIVVASPRLLRTRAEDQTPLFVRPRGIVLLIGLLAFVMFLTEGAMLDWGAVFLTENKDFPASQAGIGYALFAGAMTIGRFTGDRFTRLVGARSMLLIGATLATIGLLKIILLPAPLSLIGFLFVGLGAANIVPLLFTQAGRQKVMPAGLAIAAMSMFGYAGVLLGPALVGFVGKAFGLPIAFGMLAAMVTVVAACSQRATQPA